MKKLLIGLTLLGSMTSFAADTYTCQVTGVYTNYDKETEGVNMEVKVEVDAKDSTLFGSIGSSSDSMPWRISIDTIKDGGEAPLVLTLNAPNQNASVGRAYSETGSKYIGFIQGSTLEALCVKN